MEIPFLSLKTIAESGQVFRYECLAEDDLKHKWKYLFFMNDECLLITQTKQMFTFKCTDEEFWQKWYHYFDIGFAYDKAFYSIDKDDEILRTSARKNKGMRILNQDLWETIMTAVITDGLTFNKGREIVDLICKKFGTKKKSAIEGMQRTWYTFPTARQIERNYEILLEIEHIIGTEKMDAIYECAVDGCAKEFSEEKLAQEYSRGKDIGIKDYLKTFPELSARAANFICLCGYGAKDMFPVDSEMKRLLRDEYNINSAVQLKELYEDIFDRYEGYRGLINFYLHREAIKRKEEEDYGFDR